MKNLSLIMSEYVNRVNKYRILERNKVSCETKVAVIKLLNGL